MYGKVMSISDDLIIPYFIHCTEIPLPKIDSLQQKLKQGTNPKDLKEKLAIAITELYWGKKGADAGQKYFEKVIKQKSAPAKIQVVKVKKKDILEILKETGLAQSKAEARRLIQQKGVKIDGKTVETETVEVKSGQKIQKGKRQWVEIE